MILMSLIILLFAQDSISNYRSCQDFESYWDFYADNRTSSQACGMGYTGVASTGDISSTFINPASLSLENKKQIYFEYVYKNDIDWVYDIKYKNLNPNFSIGFGLPINDYLQTGITYRTDKSKKTDYGEIYGTMISDTAESGFINTGLLDVYKNVKISSFSVPLVFKLKDILSAGVDLSYTNFYSKTRLGGIIYTDSITDSTWTVPYTATASFNKIRPNFGIIVSPLKNLSLGFTYLPEAKENVSIELTDTTITYVEPNIFPLKIGIGISYTLDVIPMSFSLDYKHSNNSAEEGLADRNDLHFGLGYDINDNLKLRTGLFTQKSYTSRAIQLESYWENHDQIFTTFGISYKINSLALNLSLMDSHLLSSGSIEQTYLNTGISYGF
jgi:long-subunit fatty acid transport protein